MDDYNLGLLAGSLASISPYLLFAGIGVGIFYPKKRRLAGVLALLGGISILSAYLLIHTA